MKRLVVATRNSHKTREFSAILGPEFEVVDLAQYRDVPLVAETCATFAENAALKAISASRHVDELVVADDSGLQVDALRGAPGVYSARYAGVNAGDEANVRKLLSEMHRSATRDARFICVLALARRGELIDKFSGAVEGLIAAEPRGVGGFGYDPVFIPRGYDKTFAELTSALKNKLSHRARALEQLQSFLRESLVW